MGTRQEMAQRQHGAAFSLFRPSSRRVTFEIVSPRRSRQMIVPSVTQRSGLYPVSAEAIREATLPTSYPTCQLQQIPVASNSVMSENNSCPDQEEHDLGALLRRRAHHRHQHAWIRGRTEKSSALKASRSIHLQCLLSGLLFIGLLVTYLVLNFNIDLPTAVVTLFVLLILLCGILFLHGLFRAWLSKRKARWNLGSRHGHGRRRKYVYRDSHGRGHSHRHRHRRARTYRYADPESPFDMLPSDDSVYTPTTPVRVHLVQDEEAFIDEKSESVVHDLEMGSSNQTVQSPTTDTPVPTPPPPAYGLWRCSVRADPNLLHWQRSANEPYDASYLITNMSSPSEPVGASISGTRSTQAVPRPPSYASGHGVSGTETVAELEDPTLHAQSATADSFNHSGRSPLLQNTGDDAVLGQDDWPLRRVSGAVQEVTRMLLADATHPQEAI